jgi:hypothetical protein
MKALLKIKTDVLYCMKLVKYKLSLMLLFGLNVQGGNKCVEKLYESRGYFHKFMCILIDNSKIFDPETEFIEPTVDMAGLKQWIDENPQAFYAIGIQYYQ